MNFENSIKKHVKKLVGTLKSEEELQEVLKRKFTKKEYKIFVAFEEGKTIDEIKSLVKEDDSAKIKKAYQKTIKKLNQELSKKELVEF